MPNNYYYSETKNGFTTLLLVTSRRVESKTSTKYKLLILFFYKIA